MSRPKYQSRDPLSTYLIKPTKKEDERPGEALEGARLLPLSLLVPNRYFQRSQYTDITELAQSIGEKGLEQPLVVRPVEDGKFEIVAGNRRFRALEFNGAETAPCIIKDYDDREAALATAIENFQRVDLTIEDEAEMYRYLSEQLGLREYGAATELGKILHRDHTRITRVWRVAKYPELLDAVSNGETTLTAALQQITEREGTSKPRKAAPVEVVEPQTFHGEIALTTTDSTNVVASDPAPTPARVEAPVLPSQTLSSIPTPPAPVANGEPEITTWERQAHTVTRQPKQPTPLASTEPTKQQISGAGLKPGDRYQTDEGMYLVVDISSLMKTFETVVVNLATGKVSEFSPYEVFEVIRVDKQPTSETTQGQE